jgi:intein/homing endonuclease
MPKTEKPNYVEISQEYLNGFSVKHLSLKYKIKERTLRSNFEKLNIKKYQRSYGIFSTFNSTECYWAGFLAADGCVYENRIILELQIKDLNHLNKYSSFVGGHNKITIKKNSCLFRFRSSEVGLNLKENFNIIPNKTFYGVKPPDKIPNNEIRHFIRGYIDGDGSIFWFGTLRLKITSSLLEILEWFNSIFSNKFNLNSRKLNLYKGVYNLVYSGQDAINILEWIYKGTNLYLDRKYYNFLKYKEKYILNKVLNDIS